MIKEHESFPVTAPKESTIWRYMSMSKFLNFITDESLFFCRADKFHDPYEGRYGNFNIRNRPQIYGQDMSMLESLHENARRKIHINCWHINDFESAAMWELYSTNNSGIAIQSTISDLMKCGQDPEVQIGQVKYVDYENQFIPEGNLYYPFLYKRKSFEHEREIRLLVRDNTTLIGEEPEFEHGCFKKVDLKQLINSIYLSPLMPEWEEKTVRNILNRLNINYKVIKSSLYNVS